MRWIWQVKDIQIVIGALRIIPKAFKSNLRDIGVDIDLKVLQKSVLLGTERILRKILDFWQIDDDDDHMIKCALHIIK